MSESSQSEELHAGAAARLRRASAAWAVSRGVDGGNSEVLHHSKAA